MALQKLNITNEYNQLFKTSVEVDGNMIELEIFLEYNRMAGYWVASIKNLATDEKVISSMPLLADQNLLFQYGYLKIGSSAVLNISGGDPDLLDNENLGIDFIWCWDDNI